MVRVLRSTASRPSHAAQSIRLQSTAAAAAAVENPSDPSRDPTQLPSPLPERALQSAKLAALHARLSLPQKIPLQTLARTLVDVSADINPQFNNLHLAFVGQTILNYHVAELLMVRYPRLPMNVLWEAMRGYAGVKTLHQVALSWGVESAAVPGGEVDPGLLQFDKTNPVLARWATTTLGYKRVEAEYIEKYKWRRGISNRIVFDDDFGEAVAFSPNAEGRKEVTSLAAEDAEARAEAEEEDTLYSPHTSFGDDTTRYLAENAHAAFVRAVVGAVYTHCGRDAAKAFVKAHILSRTLDVEKLFKFSKPIVELATLCAREEFEPPVARLLSETGRLSRTPVFVVGIYSGADKLGEAAGPNLDAARYKAAINALKAWYLYSPGDNVRVPSDMLEEGAKPWEPVHIDIGEIISR